MILPISTKLDIELEEITIFNDLLKNVVSSKKLQVEGELDQYFGLLKMGLKQQNR